MPHGIMIHHHRIQTTLLHSTFKKDHARMGQDVKVRIVVRLFITVTFSERLWRRWRHISNEEGGW